MARAKKRRRRCASTGQTPPSPGIQRVRLPKTRLRTLLQLLIEVPTTAERALFRIEIPDDEAEKALVLFDVAVLLRGSNALKAIRLLCEQAHWEFAAAAVRQLFELVVNMEYLAAQPDREAAIFRHAKYGLLQTVQNQRLILLYDQKAGRPTDMERLAVLDSMLEHTFPEFRTVSQTGKVRWARSWSDRTTRSLAQQSEHSLREDQYDLLFSTWSEQAHASPAVLLDMVMRKLPADEIVASDDARIAETVTMAITLFIELWTLLPHVAAVEPAQILKWTNTVIAEVQKHGAPTQRAGPSDVTDAS